MTPRRFGLVAASLLLCLLTIRSVVGTRLASQTTQEAASQSTADCAAQATPTPVTSYTLPPDRYQQAHDISRAYFAYQLLTFAYTIVILLLVIKFKVGPMLCQWAEGVTRRRLAQAYLFTSLLLILLLLLLLPTDIYRHWLTTRYGLSIQGWRSWFWDWAKFQSIVVLLASFISWLLYGIIRRSPRRWWCYFWLASLPLGLVLVFLQPLIFDPLFHRFEPLAHKDVALTTELQRLVKRAGETIPPERMFWMEAGNKTTTLNAYVAGFGASKRIVVWDTTIAHMTTPQIVFVTGHEMGHYVLHHIAKGLLAGALLLLVVFYLGSWWVEWIIRRWGQQWGVAAVADWSSMPILLLMLVILGFVMTPIESAVSRYFEHQADQYALEVTHGLMADSAQVGAQTFQILGDFGLADPRPNPVDVFMFYDHPPITDRLRFCLTYDPWSKGESPEFVR